MAQKQSKVCAIVSRAHSPPGKKLRVGEINRRLYAVIRKPGISIC